MDEQSKIQADDDTVATNFGREIDNIISMRDFVSEQEKLMFAAHNPPLTKMWLGVIMGKCTGGEEKITVRPDNSKLRSFMFTGYFESERYVDGVVKNAVACFLPKAIQAELEMTLKAEIERNPNEQPMVAFDLEMGMEVTGKSIPIGYRVRAFHQKTVDVLGDLRAARKSRLTALPPAQRAAALAHEVATDPIVPTAQGTAEKASKSAKTAA